MDRVDKAVAHYLTAWNDQYGLVNDKDIVIWQVRNVMHDIEYWVDGEDPNGALETCGYEDWTRAEFVKLYRSLAPSASFFGLRANPEILADTG